MHVKRLPTGIPLVAADIEAWIAYESFIAELDSDQDVSVQVEAYLYGEGETVKATPEEVAYFTMRMDADTRFLQDRCKNTEDMDFTISWSTEQLFGRGIDILQ